MKKHTRKEKVIIRIWDTLEELGDQMSSAAAEGMTQKELDFVDSRLTDILRETSKWFVGLENRCVGKRKRAPVAE